MLFVLPPGKRLVICGQTGSGKSTLGRRYLERSNYHWVIFNPKGTKIYNRLVDRETLTRITEDKVFKSIRKRKYTVLNFPSQWTADFQDGLLLSICQEFENIGVLIDELYMIHKNGRSGPGLDGLITRGRELNQSFIGCTQRPMFVSNFIFSESEYLAEFQLNIKDDRIKIYRNTGVEATLERQSGHDFLFFDVAEDRAILYRA